MSFDYLPERLEQSVLRYAQERHLTHDQAVIRLIESGLDAVSVPPPIPGLSGSPMSDQDAAMIDDVVLDAMEARRERWERYQRA